MPYNIGWWRQLTREAEQRKQATAEAAAKFTQTRLQTSKVEEDPVDIHRRYLVVTERIDTAAKAQARQGLRYATVYDISFDEVDQPDPLPEGADYSLCEPHMLRGVAKLIYEHCRENGLSPSIQFWHDGVGVNGGWKLNIHW